MRDACKRIFILSHRDPFVSQSALSYELTGHEYEYDRIIYLANHVLG